MFAWVCQNIAFASDKRSFSGTLLKQWSNDCALLVMKRNLHLSWTDRSTLLVMSVWSLRAVKLLFWTWVICTKVESQKCDKNPSGVSSNAEFCAESESGLRFGVAQTVRELWPVKVAVAQLELRVWNGSLLSCRPMDGVIERPFNGAFEAGSPVWRHWCYAPLTGRWGPKCGQRQKCCVWLRLVWRVSAFDPENFRISGLWSQIWAEVFM